MLSVVVIFETEFADRVLVRMLLLQSRVEDELETDLFACREQISTKGNSAALNL